MVIQNTTSPPTQRNAPRRRIGELLIEAGFITEQDLNDALAESKKSAQYVGQILIRNGKLTREQLGDALGKQYNIPYCNLTNMALDTEIFNLLPHDFIRDKMAIPIAKEEGRLVVAMVNPLDRSAIDEITLMTGMRPQPMVTTTLDFAEVAGKHIRERSSSNLITEISTAVYKNSDIEEAPQHIENLESAGRDIPLVKLVYTIIQEAIERNASDIHIEPRKDEYKVRIRIDGILFNLIDIPKVMEATFVTRIKVMARMDIAEHRRPQDGRFALLHKGAEFNFRVSVLPVMGEREKIVIRILRPAKNIGDFRPLGFDEDDIKKIEHLYQSPYGIVLVCGPTGSGKTTTLYTILNQINDHEINISTVEDPVEMVIPGLNQSQVNVKADYTFATSLRCLMRQDPDVIMVGEIRDFETLESAIHAALTGHLVFSTIHANTAVGTLTRMKTMGADPSLVSSSLMGVVAQRLARRLCLQCKEEYAATEEELQLLFGNNPRPAGEVKLFRAKGCGACGKSGYSGRVGLYEIMILDRDIRNLINEGRPELEIEDAAIAAGMKTLGMQGRKKILDGLSTVEEMVRVLGPTLGGN